MRTGLALVPFPTNPSRGPHDKEKRLDDAVEEGVGAEGGAAFSFAFYTRAVTVADLRLSGLCLVVSRGNGFGFLSGGWEAGESPRGYSAISLAGKVWFTPGRRKYNSHEEKGRGREAPFEHDVLGPKLKRS